MFWSFVLVGLTFVGAPMQSLSDMKAQMMNGSAGSLSRTNSTSSVDRAEGKPTEKVHRRCVFVTKEHLIIYRNCL